MDINMIFIMFCIFSLGAASGYFSERVGIINIGINGMMIFGAMMYTVFGALLNGKSFDESSVGSSLGDNFFLLAMILSTLSTLVVGVFFGFSTIYLKTDHVIAGTAINLLGAGIGLLFTNILGPMLLGDSVSELKNAFLHTWLIQGEMGLFGSVLLLTIITIVIIAVFMIVFKFTKFGLRYKSIGENPNASDSQGINVTKYQWTGVLISSLFAGLAGSIFMYRTGGTVSFFGEVDGLGFMAIAIMITGSWRLPLIVIVSIVFSVLYTFSDTTVNKVDKNIIKLIPYIVTILFLVLFSKKIQAPKFVGQHFDKSQR